jgi:transcriptional regulator with XRE-family HTH domain
MGRKLSKPRPLQGARIAQLRKAAGLSQYQLAHLLGESQANIAFWEKSDKPPRADLLPALAKIFHVPIDALIANSANKVFPSLKSGPVGKVRRVFDEVSKLPRNQQDKIVEFVSFFIKQYKQSKSR